ncbi:MAG: FAD-binding oxidoreductase, partial [Deltaproteobacteria bacterium]|nr:FAD-binding oxidoreductase [Deltaproteobacteria bacterium]
MPEGESLARFQDLYWSSYFRMADLAKDLKEKGKVDIEYGSVPMILASFSERSEQAYKAMLSNFIKNGHFESEWLDSNDLNSIFPGINPKVRGGLCIPQLQVEPYKYTLGLGMAAEEMGA